MKHGDIQHLRGLACLMLVLYHVVGADPGRGLQIESGALRLLSDSLAAVRMPLFALLAGALYGLRPRAGIAALSSKARRLLWPVLSVGTVFALVQAWVPGTREPVVDWHLLHLVPVGHFWFLQSLFLVFAWVMLAEHLGLLRSRAGCAAVATASVLTYLSQPGFIWLGVAGAVYLLPYFLLGMALTRGHLPLPRQRGLFALALAGTSLLAMQLWLAPSHDTNRFSAGMLWLGLMLSLALWARPPRLPGLPWIGEHSYAIFLFHVFFSAGMRIALQRAGIDSVAAHLVLGMSAAVLGPVLVKHLLQGWPAASRVLLGEVAPRHPGGRSVSIGPRPAC